MAIVRSTMREQTYSALLDMITRGELGVGQAVDEVGLAKRLNVSRTPLREALRQLVIEGLVVSKAYRGYEVRSMSFAEVAELYAVRIELEVLAIRNAVPRMTDENISEISELLDQGVEALKAEDLGAYSEIDKQFHARIAALSGNRTIIEILARLGLQVQLCRVVANRDSAVAERAAQEREELLQAFRHRDAELAASIMRVHISNVRNGVIEQLRIAEEENAGVVDLPQASGA